jgi:AcrR family transcriptional regulator
MTQAGKLSRQAEAGEVTRRETRRRLLVAAAAEFAERGYAAATVSRIAERAGVSVQSLYSNWGSKRNLLRALFEDAVAGEDEAPHAGQPSDGQPPAVMTATLDPAEAADPRKLLAQLSHQHRLLAERAAVAWQAYREAAGGDQEVAADLRQLNDFRRVAVRKQVARIPAEALRPGLALDLAADIAWVITSPGSHELLVGQGGYGYDQFEDWVRVTLTASLLPD